MRRHRERRAQGPARIGTSRHFSDSPTSTAQDPAGNANYAASGTARARASAQDSFARIVRSACSRTRSIPRTRSGESAHSCLSRLPSFEALGSQPRRRELARALRVERTPRHSSRRSGSTGSTGQPVAAACMSRYARSSTGVWRPRASPGVHFSSARPRCFSAARASRGESSRTACAWHEARTPARGQRRQPSAVAARARPASSASSSESLVPHWYLGPLRATHPAHPKQ